jgi:ribosomal protein S8
MKGIHRMMTKIENLFQIKTSVMKTMMTNLITSCLPFCKNSSYEPTLSLLCFVYIRLT